MTEAEGESTSLCSCKVGAVAAEYGFKHVHENLKAEWTDEDGPSVRSLTDTFNKRILQSAFRRAGSLPIDGEIDNVYRLLCDDDTDAAARMRVHERLRQEGIDVEDIEERLISHQTLYRHLVECLDASYDPPEKSTDERIDTWRTRMLALQNRTASVTAQGIEQLARHDALTTGSIDVTVDVTVACDECGQFYPLEEFLSTGGCDCPVGE